MTFPSSAHLSSTHLASSSHASSSVQVGAHQPGAHRSGTPTCTSATPLPRSDEGDHQLEKLQFALAIALTRGDHQREQVLRDQIVALGGYCEEPGT